MKRNYFWQLITLLALFCYVAVVGLMLLFVIKHPLVIGTLLGLTLVIFYASWLIITGTDERLRTGRLLATGATILWLIIAVLFGIQLMGSGTVAAITFFICLYLLLLRLIKQHLRQRRISTATQKQKQQFRNPYLIINPKSGNGRAEKAGLAAAAKAQGVTVLTLHKKISMENLAHKAVQAGADVLGVSGGDGSIGAIAKIAIEHDLPIIVLAGGTRCHFARDLGLDPRYIKTGLQAYYGNETRIDIATINGRVFLNNASLGLYADIVDNPEYRENKFVTSKRVLRQHLNGEKQPYDLQCTDEKIQYHSAVQILVSINAYSTRSLLEIGERENMAGGILQISMLKQLSDSLIKRLLKLAPLNNPGHIPDLPEIAQWEAKQFIVNSSQAKLVIGVDGEREVYKTPVTITIHSKALRIYLPSNLQTGRKKKAFSFTMPKILWSLLQNGETNEI